MKNKIFTLIFLSVSIIFSVSCSTNDKHVIVLALSKQLHAVLYNDNSESIKTASKTYTQKNEIKTITNPVNTKVEEYKKIETIDKKEEVKIVINNDKNEVLITANIISFDFDSYELKKEYDNGINEIYKYLKENRDINLIIEGHSDNRGDSNYNIYLSENRAKAIYNKLIDKGIDKTRLRYIGYGSTHSSEYNVKDRKCQFVIINDSNEESKYKKENETDIIKLKN
ncbi:OmpA family protein [Brachyspira sp.]|uniref:OmpA family protein n=1 Tax=Brachyspira sp. TaxID=1977261 RepID=UPI0026150BFE|nr:OmpA family protein [Brachyspira sp.]